MFESLSDYVDGKKPFEPEVAIAFILASSVSVDLVKESFCVPHYRRSSLICMAEEHSHED